MSKAEFWQKDQDEISQLSQERASLREKVDQWNRYHQEAEDAAILVEMAIEEEDGVALEEVRNDISQLQGKVKNLEWHFNRMEIAPTSLVERLKLINDARLEKGAAYFSRLVTDLLDLVDRHAPGPATAAMRNRFQSTF